MDPMMMGGMPPQDPMGGMGGGQIDPQILAALMATMGGGAMPGPMGMQGGPSMEDSASFAPGTGGTTPMSIPQQPIADTQTLSGGMDPSMLLQALMGMSQGGAQMGGQMPVGGAF